MSRGPWKKHQIQEAMASAGMSALMASSFWPEIMKHIDGKIHALTNSYMESAYDLSDELKAEAMLSLANYVRNGATTAVSGYKRIGALAVRRRYEIDLKERKAHEQVEVIIAWEKTVKMEDPRNPYGNIEAEEK